MDSTQEMEERSRKEDLLVDEILKKVDELAELIKQDYDEIADPRNRITDPQGIDQYIDDFLREIIKRLRKAGYAIPSECYDSECELFNEEEE